MKMYQCMLTYILKKKIRQNHSLDINNQNVQQIYMDKSKKCKKTKTKNKHVVCKNTYNNMAKRLLGF